MQNVITWGTRNGNKFTCDDLQTTVKYIGCTCFGIYCQVEIIFDFHLAVKIKCRLALFDLAIKNFKTTYYFSMYNSKKYLNEQNLNSIWLHLSKEKGEINLEMNPVSVFISWEKVLVNFSHRFIQVCWKYRRVSSQVYILEKSIFFLISSRNKYSHFPFLWRVVVHKSVRPLTSMVRKEKKLPF